MRLAHGGLHASVMPPSWIIGCLTMRVPSASGRRRCRQAGASGGRPPRLLSPVICQIRVASSGTLGGGFRTFADVGI